MRLGILHVERDVLFGLTAKQFRAWQHYFELEPFDETRQDYRIASIVQMLYNVNRGKNSPVGKLQDFVLKFGEQEERPKQTTQQQLSLLQVLAHMHANDPTPEAPKKVAEGPSEEQIAAALEKARKAMN